MCSPARRRTTRRRREAARRPLLACTLALLAVLASSLGSRSAEAQNLSGSYIYASPQGPVALSLQQDAQGRVTGRLDGADGSVLRLDGRVEGGRASGQISTTGGTGWFATGSDGSRLLLLVAELDPASGQPDLSQSWTLEFTRAPTAGPAPAPAPPPLVPTPGAPTPAPPATGQPDPFSQPDQSQLAREWREMLRGAKLTRISSYNSSTPGGGGYSEHWEAFLCSDGTLHFRDNSFTSYGNLNAHSARQGSGMGRWQVVTRENRSFLASQFEGQSVLYGELTFDPAQRATFLDGNRFYITRNDNDVCP
jgi:hypothetical protein